jgi:hypothetical protein
MRRQLHGLPQEWCKKSGNEIIGSSDHRVIGKSGHRMIESSESGNQKNNFRAIRRLSLIFQMIR